MRRRSLLAIAGTACLAAGCLSDPGDPGRDSEPNGTDPSSDDGDDTDDDDIGDEDDTDASDESPESFEVSIDRPGYVVSMREQFPESGPNDVTPVSELNDAARSAIETAAEEGRYETDEPSDALLRGLHGTWHASIDGTVYELSWELPEHVVTGTEVDESAVDPDETIGMRDDLIRVLDVDNESIAMAVNAVVDRSEGATGRNYRATVLDDELDSFLDEYTYVAYPDDGENGPEPEGYVRLEYAFDDPGGPYAVFAEELPDERRYGTRVVDVDEYDDEVADLFEQAAEGRSIQVDDVPDGFPDAAAGDSYVRVDGKVYEPELTDVDHEAIPLAVDARGVDEGDRSFELAIEAEADLRIFSGAPAPFGVMRAVGGDGDELATLWSDAYEADGHVHVDEDEREIVVNDIGLTTDVEAGESVAETYEARSEWGFETGRYVCRSSLPIEWNESGDERSATFPFAVTIEIPEPEDDD